MTLHILITCTLYIALATYHHRIWHNYDWTSVSLYSDTEDRESLPVTSQGVGWLFSQGHLDAVAHAVSFVRHVEDGDLEDE